MGADTNAVSQLTIIFNYHYFSREVAEQLDLVGVSDRGLFSEQTCRSAQQFTLIDLCEFAVAHNFVACRIDAANCPIRHRVHHV